ncbi:unnamed protein product [Blepharisma stoltei]|uniref:Uncharacterized protein n=1 Tax=Blepharisma stoltei TaxID=1481888 RepID=A0AAU9JBG4_9CILI|nr:unnamed protein product [Blepharisma stoltei]
MSLIGTFIPKKKRQALVKDLRSTHFSFGYRSNSTFENPNKSFTISQSQEKLIPISQESSVNLGRSKSVTKSVSAAAFTPKTPSKIIKNFQEIQNNTHHFTLGNYSGENNIEEAGKSPCSPFNTSFEIEAAKSHIRNENNSSVVLGNNYIKPISIFQSDFADKKFEKNKNLLEDFKKFMDKNHFEVGKEKWEYTTSMTDMNKDISAGVKADILRLNENIYIGGVKLKPELYKTSQKNDFQGKINETPNPSFSHKDIFSNSFKLGYHKKSSRSSNFESVPIDLSFQTENYIKNKQKCGKSHVKLGIDSINLNSTYAQTHSLLSTSQTTPAGNGKSSVLLGTDPSAFASLYSSSFHPKSCCQVENPNIKPKTFSHITLGASPNNSQYMTVNKSYTRLTGISNNNTLKIEDQKKGSHFQFGNDPIKYETTNNLDFNIKITKPEISIFQRKNIEKSKKPGDFETVNQKAYKWITPVPE